VTIWNHDIKRTEAQRISYGDQTCIVVWDKGNDFQRGDALTFVGDGNRCISGIWEITHVSKNQNGIDSGYAVLSLKAPDADYFKNQVASYREMSLRNNRTIAALRGQITKLRNRIEASS
jgi:hypothetical protein